MRLQRLDMSRFGNAGAVSAAVLLFALAGLVSAGDDKQVFTRVEAGRADVGPSATSMRVMPRDTRGPSGFEYVYRIERGKYAGRFARRDGAITAVFPRSVYTQVDGALVAHTPPGTTYVLGAVGADEPGSGQRQPHCRGAGVTRADMSVMRGASTPAGTNAVDMSASASASGSAAAVGTKSAESAKAATAKEHAAEARPEPAAPVARTMWTDDAMRTRRVGQLLESVRRVTRAK